MLFSSNIFIFLFLPAVLFGYYVIFRKTRLGQNIFLTLSSLFFYAWGEPRFVMVMLLSIIANWAFALWVDKVKHNKKETHLALITMLVFNLSIIFIFKYLMFTLNNINNIFHTHINVPEIILPIGISFFTFHSISYVIDISRGNYKAQRNPLNVGLYISLFPQLIAGPIIRYHTIADQIEGRKETLNDFSCGICRFVIGLAKKVLLANTLAIVADKAFTANSSGEGLSVGFALLGALAYTFQIFFDFSGYSDMAIGLGRMFGFHFPENFNYPYISISITEFWRRWHISLSSWFRDYVYFPLGGSRVDSKWRLAFNLFVVWTLTGVWHGANWTFIIWGIMYFALITIEKLTKIGNKIGRFGHIYTLFFVIIGWVFFRAEYLGLAIDYLKALTGINSNGIIDNKAIMYFSENKYFYLFAIIFSMPVTEWIKDKFPKSKMLDFLYPVVMIFLFVTSVSYIIKGAYNPFIYFNF